MYSISSYAASGSLKPACREKLMERGAESLLDEELLAVLLRTGVKDIPVMELARNIIRHIDKNKFDEIENSLHNIKGMGESKIAAVLAAFELGRRYFACSSEKISSPAEIVPFLKHYANRNQEHFICVSLNGANEIIAVRVVSIGSLTSTIVHPREVFADVIVDRAAAIIVAHNHPSGNTEPSEEDIMLTERLLEAGYILGIHLLDHIILSPRGNYLSFAQKGLLKKTSEGFKKI